MFERSYDVTIDLGRFISRPGTRFTPTDHPGSNFGLRVMISRDIWSLTVKMNVFEIWMFEFQKNVNGHIEDHIWNFMSQLFIHQESCLYPYWGLKYRLHKSQVTCVLSPYYWILLSSYVLDVFWPGIPPRISIDCPPLEIHSSTI